MKPIWLLETGFVDDTEKLRKLIILDGAEVYEYSDPSLYPMDLTIHKNKPFIARGFKGTVQAWADRGYKVGWESDEFSCTAAQRNFGSCYYNFDGEAMPISHVEEYLQTNRTLNRGEGIFVRPDADSKKFSGRTLDYDGFTPYIESLRSSGYLNPDDDFPVYVSSAKPVPSEEYRAVIVGGEIVAYSMYMRNGEKKYRAYLPSDARYMIETLLNVFNPVPAFVMDIGMTRHGFAILECNSFNSAELYHCDMRAVVQAVNEYVDNPPEIVPVEESAHD